MSQATAMAPQAQSKPTNEVAVEIVGMHKWYGEFHVLKDINLKVTRGEKIVVCGPSGSGKTTLLTLIAGIISADGGTLWLKARHEAVGQQGFEQRGIARDDMHRRIPGGVFTRDIRGRLVVAEDDEQALREVHAGERRETVTYFEDTLGRPPGRADDPLRDGVKMGTTLVGSPETVAKGIERLLGFSNGGFGGVLFRAHEWATREQTMRSYELFARYVMPRFQGSLDTIVNSNQWAKDNRKGIFGPNVAAVKKASWSQPAVAPMAKSALASEASMTLPAVTV